MVFPILPEGGRWVCWKKTKRIINKERKKGYKGVNGLCQCSVFFPVCSPFLHKIPFFLVNTFMERAVCFESVTFSFGEKKWPLCESILHCFAVFCHTLSWDFQAYSHQHYCDVYTQLYKRAKQIETKTREFTDHMTAQKCTSEDTKKVVKETMGIYRLWLDATTQEIPLGRDVHIHALDYVSGFLDNDGEGPQPRPLDVMPPPMEVTWTSIPCGHYDDTINNLRALFFDKAYRREIIIFVPVDCLIELITGYLFDIHCRPFDVLLPDRLLYT